MGIYHGRGHVLVPEQCLNSADIRAALQQMGGKAVPEGMGAHFLADSFLPDGGLDSLVDDARVNMMAAHFAGGSGVGGQIAGGKNILPDPFALSAWILLRQGMGQIDFATTGLKVFLMEQANSLDAIFDRGTRAAGKGVTRSLSPLPERTVICL